MILGQFADGPAVRTDYNQTDPSKADYLVGRENIAPKTHVEDKNNPHGVTIAEIGAAPSGYGLGNYGATVNSPDDAVMSGFYRAPAPAEIASSGYMYGVVFSNSANWVTQIWQVGGHLIRRNLSSGAWEDYEYINPPMVPSKEYRTTERYNGNPVYTKLIYLGKMPNNAAKNVYMGIASTAKVFFIDGYMASSDDVVYTTFATCNNVGTNTYNDAISIIVTGDYSDYSAVLLIKYTNN